MKFKKRIPVEAKFPELKNFDLDKNDAEMTRFVRAVSTCAVSKLNIIGCS